MVLRRPCPAACGVMLVIAVVSLGLLACSHHGGRELNPEEATRTAIGDPAPPLRLTAIDGTTFDLAEQAGKVVLVNFWATWCPPCRAEMPHLRDEVWQPYRGRDDFVMVSIARGETAEKVAPFVAEHGYGWQFATDPEGAGFAQYADAFIPRNYVIGRDGRIRYQNHGFEPAEFAGMVAVLAREFEVHR